MNIDENNYMSSASNFSNSSSLPETVRSKLQEGINVGLPNGTLDLSYESINDQMIPELCEWLYILEGKIKQLCLIENKLTSKGAVTLFHKLRDSNSRISRIFLNGNQLDDMCLMFLGAYIQSNQSIEGISVCNNLITDSGVAFLVPYFRGNITFKSLNVSWNKNVTGESIPNLMKIIEESRIEDIDVYQTSILQINSLTVAVVQNKIICGTTKLDLREKQLNDDNVIKICQLMKKHGINKLKEIDLGNNKITTRGGIVLFDTLRECNSAVTRLSIFDNKINDDGIKSLGEYVQDNESLEHLNMTFNEISDTGIELLKEYLIGNATLSELLLNGNTGITDASMPSFEEIAKRTCITNVTTLWTSISPDIQPRISSYFNTPISERGVPLKSNSKSAAKIFQLR